MVFFVGPSGIGKSTILEAMGLMNKTIMDGCEKFDYMGQDMREWWNLSDKAQSKFRLQEFSFIFQSNNLMTNFSVWENVKATALFQGMTNKEAENKKRNIFEATNLMELLDFSNERITKFSGGQRQRMAFARAIMPKFNVLFGDEPTGNLDPSTAQTIMGNLRDILKQNNDKTAIIVSHDIRLATMFADRIVLFHKVEGNSEQPVDGENKNHYGLIDNKSIYIRTDSGWTDFADTKYNNERLSEYLSQQMRDETLGKEAIQ